MLKPNEAMLEEALTAGSRVALLTTFEPGIPSLKAELEQLAERGLLTVLQCWESKNEALYGSTPHQFHAYLKSEVAKFGKLVKAAGIKAAAGG